MMTSRRMPSVVAASALAAGALLLAPAGAGGQAPPPGGCEQPYAPVYFDESPASSGETLTEPAIDATEVPQGPPGRNGAFDTDGDGVDDTVTTTADTVTIVRGDGALVLTVAGTPEIHASLVGDLDGDGRDEIVVRAGWESPFIDAQQRATDGAFLIPGSTAVGTHEAADVGIAFGPDVVSLWAPPDGSVRLLAVYPFAVGIPAHTEIHDAAAVMALGPGGDATTLTPDVALDELVPVSTVDLGDPVPALLLAATGEPNPGRMVLGVVQGTEVTLLTTEPERYYSAYTSLIGDLSVLVGPDGTFVRLAQGERAGDGLYVWSLDDPCTALSAAETPTAPPAPPTAPPAEPIATEATFTG